MTSVATASIVYPPGTEWLMEFMSLEKQVQIKNARIALGEFTKAVMQEAGHFGNMAYTVCGLVYEQAFLLVRETVTFLRKNGIRCKIQVTETDDGDPINSVRIRAGNSVLKFTEERDTHDMIEEAIA